MLLWLKKVRHQWRWIKYLKTGSHVNKYRVAEQWQVMRALFGIPLKDEMLQKHLRNLDAVMHNDKLYQVDIQRFKRTGVIK